MTPGLIDAFLMIGLVAAVICVAVSILMVVNRMWRPALYTFLVGCGCAVVAFIPLGRFVYALGQVGK